MHAFLITGGSEEGIAKRVNQIINKYKLQALRFEIATIGDVRNLNVLTNLKITRPTGIIINNIQKATTEALNAFLKNLEEPQPNLYYIVAAPDIRGIIPTVVSRCSVISLKGNRNNGSDNNNGNPSDFLSMPTNERLRFVDKITDRKSALNFIDSLIVRSHSNLARKDGNIRKTARILSLAEKTRQVLVHNGNVRLHLVNFAINI